MRPKYRKNKKKSRNFPTSLTLWKILTHPNIFNFMFPLNPLKKEMKFSKNFLSTKNAANLADKVHLKICSLMGKK